MAGRTDRTGMGIHDFLHKEISIYYTDGDNVNRKDGILVGVKKYAIYIRYKKRTIVYIPFSKIVRIEIKGVDDGKEGRKE